MPGWGLLTEGGEAPKKLHEVDLKVTLYVVFKTNFLKLIIPFYFVSYKSNQLYEKLISFILIFLQVIWMKECRENFKYKKSWISSKMLCTYK